MAENSNKELVLFYNVENLFSPDPKPIHKLDPTVSGFRNWDKENTKTNCIKLQMFSDSSKRKKVFYQ